MELKVDMGVIKTKVTGMEDHLAKLNGRLAKQEEKLQAEQIALLTHVSDCPLKDQIKPLESFVATHTAKAANNKEWWEHLAPFGYGLLMVIFGLALGHSDMVAKFLGK
jgi:hypothetical protein